MSKKRLPLIPAFILGRVLEELASFHRRDSAIRIIRKIDPAFHDDPALNLSRREKALAQQSLTTLCMELLPYIPGKLMELCERIDDADPTGIGSMDPSHLFKLHNAVAGIICEGMPRGATWHCLQVGRHTQRAWLLVCNIRDTLHGHSHMPSNSLLSYIALRTDNPVADMHRGTHLWNIHRVFQDVLKTERNPKSLLSTLGFLEGHLMQLPQPEALKKDHERMLMTVNRITNDLSFIDIHEMIGDDPDDHFSHIMEVFDRHMHETENLLFHIRQYLEQLETYMAELPEDEIFRIDY